MTPDDHRQRLKECRQRRNALAMEHNDLQFATARHTRNALSAGLSKVEVAKLLGISRPTLYKILDG